MKLSLFWLKRGKRVGEWKRKMQWFTPHYQLEREPHFKHLKRQRNFEKEHIENMILRHPLITIMRQKNDLAYFSAKFFLCSF